jgi:nucleoside-diphosphate-sugar epimerase
MRIAVTGAAGLLGSALVDALARDDRIEQVVAIDLRPIEPVREKVRVVRGDMRDPGVAADLGGADALVHLAFRDHEVRGSVESNVEAARDVFAAAIAGGARTIVYASSSAVYGGNADNALPLREDDPLRPTPFVYPLTKVAVERLLEQLEADHPHTRIVRLRPSWVIGRGARLLLAGRAYLSLSDFDPLVQATWLDDAVSAFVAVLHAPSARGPYNVGAPAPVRASQIPALIGVRGIRLPYRLRRVAAATATGLRAPGALHPGFVDMDRFPIVLDASRAASELGWQARHDVAGAFRLFAGTL